LEEESTPTMLPITIPAAEQFVFDPIAEMESSIKESVVIQFIMILSSTFQLETDGATVHANKFVEMDSQILERLVIWAATMPIFPIVAAQIVLDPPVEMGLWMPVKCVILAEPFSRTFFLTSVEATVTCPLVVMV